MNEMDNMVVDGFKVGELREAMTKVQNPQNWKLPIVARIQVADFAKVKAAVSFFCGSPLQKVGEEMGGMVKVYGPGYYECVGA